MGTDDDKGRALRAALDKAIEKNRPKDVIAALHRLEQLEPREPRWPQRLGDTLQRAGRKKEAEDAYVRALDVLIKEGFLPRAVAMAKIIVALNPARTDALERIEQSAARSHRAAIPGLVKPVARTVSSDSCPPLSSTAFTSGPPSLVPGGPPPEVVIQAKQLEPAVGAASDEVRFDDLPDEEVLEVNASDMEVITIASPSRLAPPPPKVEDRNAAWVARMSATALFADVPRTALVELARAAQLQELDDDELVCRRGDSADVLYVIAEGVARVSLPWMEGGGVDLAEGQVFGEACLFESATRQADVRARGHLQLLCISRNELHRIMKTHTDLNDVLFSVLAGRLIANLLQTSSLFAAFDLEQRRELAKMFEVRRAASGTELQQEGKRADGLYVALLGQFDMEEGGLVVSLPLGSVFGHASLLSRVPADRTVRATTESVVLRMPATRFSAFAAEFPPALDHLAALAAEPTPMWPTS